LPDVIFKTNSSMPDADVGCRAAIVSINKNLALLILKRSAIFKAALKKDKSLFELRFWDSSPEYLSGEGVDCIPEEYKAMLDQECAVKMKSAFRNSVLTEECFQRTDVELMHVREGGVSWSAIPKHSDVTVETEELQLSVVRKIAGVKK
jgi:hypothetical protein